jgi:hypothetical protein
MVQLGGGLYSVVFSLLFFRFRLDEDLFIITLFNVLDSSSGKVLLGSDNVEGMEGWLERLWGSGCAEHEVEGGGLSEGGNPRGSKAVLYKPSETLCSKPKGASATYTVSTLFVFSLFFFRFRLDEALFLSFLFSSLDSLSGKVSLGKENVKGMEGWLERAVGSGDVEREVEGEGLSEESGDPKGSISALYNPS